MRDTPLDYPSFERAFKSSRILALLKPILLLFHPSASVSRSTSGHPNRKAWSTTTTAQGPILPTHNLQFHILFPSRVRQRGIEKREDGVSTLSDKLVSPFRSPIIFPAGSLWFLTENGGSEVREIVIYDTGIIFAEMTAFSSLSLEIILT